MLVFHVDLGLMLFIAGFIALFLFLWLIASMRDQLLRVAPSESTGLDKLLEATDLVRIWGIHCQLFPSSSLRTKVKLLGTTAAALLSVGFLLICMGR